MNEMLQQNQLDTIDTIGPLSKALSVNIIIAIQGSVVKKSVLLKYSVDKLLRRLRHSFTF